MKIVHFSHVPLPEDAVRQYHAKNTHPGRWGLNHAIAQKRAGMDVEVVSIAHKASCDFIREMDGVRVHFLRTFYPYRHLTFYAVDQFRMAHYAKKLSPDLIHAHGTENVFAIAAIRTGLPFCVTAQGLMFQIFPTLDHRPSIHWRAVKVMEDYAWKRTRRAIAKSEYVREALAEKYPHLDLTLIPNTYQAELDPAMGDGLMRDGRERGHTLAFVGTMDERKGVHLIAEAMTEVVKRFPDTTLHLAGNRTTDEASDFASRSDYEAVQIRRLRELLGERLVLHGRLLPAGLFRMLDGCAALLAPSQEEMFGNQLIEALMRGCHGIVADQTALAENVRRFGNGTIVPQKDAPALAKAICELFSVPRTIAQAEAAQNAIRKYMSPDVVAEKHRLLYERILKEEGASTSL